MRCRQAQQTISFVSCELADLPGNQLGAEFALYKYSISMIHCQHLFCLSRFHETRNFQFTSSLSNQGNLSLPSMSKSKSDPYLSRISLVCSLKQISRQPTRCEVEPQVGLHAHHGNIEGTKNYISLLAPTNMIYRIDLVITLYTCIMFISLHEMKRVIVDMIHDSNWLSSVRCQAAQNI